MDQRRPEDRPFADRHGRPFEERAKDTGENIKEDIKGGARRLEGNLRDDEGLKREHDKSTLEKAGEQIKCAYHSACNKVTEVAHNMGLTDKKPDNCTCD